MIAFNTLKPLNSIGLLTIFASNLFAVDETNHFGAVEHSPTYQHLLQNGKKTFRVSPLEGQPDRLELEGVSTRILSLQADYHDEEYTSEYIVNGDVTNNLIKKLSKIESEKAKVFLRNGMLVNTDGLVTIGEDNYPGIFVIGLDGQMYISNIGGNIGNNIRHSSFLAGGPVLSAGEIAVFEGKIIYLNNNSGHYKPTVNIFEKIRRILDVKKALHASVNFFDEEFFEILKSAQNSVDLKTAQIARELLEKIESKGNVNFQFSEEDQLPAIELLGLIKTSNIRLHNKLVIALHDKNNLLRCSAARALNHIKPHNPIVYSSVIDALLVDAVESTFSQQKSCQQEFIEVLKNHENLSDNDLEKINSMLRSRYRQARSAAIDALASVRSLKGGIYEFYVDKLLVEALKNNREDVRTNASLALVKIRPKNILTLKNIASLFSDIYTKRVAAIETLVGIEPDNTEFLLGLIKMLDDPEFEIYQSAEAVLKRIKIENKRALAELEKLMRFIQSSAASSVAMEILIKADLRRVKDFLQGDVNHETKRQLLRELTALDPESEKIDNLLSSLLEEIQDRELHTQVAHALSSRVSRRKL